MKNPKDHPLKKWMLTPIIFFVYLLFISPSYPADNSFRLVTDELLIQLGLDRGYHRCISVADGDTLTLEGLKSIRFVGVDTPEKNHPTLPVQFMSQEASKFTKQLCLGKKIRLEYDPYDEDKRGEYGRVLGYLYLEDGTCVQEELLKNGYAIAYTKYPMDEDRKKHFLKLERIAREKELGLWKENGLQEVNWILKQNYPMLQISSIGKRQYSLGYWKYILSPISIANIEDESTQLYKWIYELSSGDLDKKLTANGYEEREIKSDPDAIYLLGMAHKKWGILYKEQVYCRALKGELNDIIKDAFDIISRNSSKLANIGFRKVSVQYSLPPDSLHKNADCPNHLLSGLNLVICWDKAGDYIGEKVNVVGLVSRTFKNDKVCFLNFHNNFTKYMSVVIFSGDFHIFPDDMEKYFLNKTILVSGKIKEYKDKPEIIVNRRNQIKILN